MTIGAVTTAVRIRGVVPPVPGDPPARRVGDAVSGDDLLRMWEDAVGQVQGLVPVLAHTVDELARHVQDKRTAEHLFTQDGDRGPGEPEG